MDHKTFSQLGGKAGTGDSKRRSLSALRKAQKASVAARKAKKLVGVAAIVALATV